MSVTACATRTKIKLYTMIRFSENLINSSCELHKNGKFLQSIVLEMCVQVQREMIDVDTDLLTVVCHICDDHERIRYNIPKSVLTNASDCATDGMSCVQQRLYICRIRDTLIWQ